MNPFPCDPPPPGDDTPETQTQPVSHVPPTETDSSSAGLPMAGAISFTGYRLIRRLSQGGQGIVFLAVQESTGRKVAIKVLSSGPFATAADRTRFDREARVLAALDHPAIVPILDRG